MKKNEVLSLFKNLNFHPKKKFGQNFLISEYVRDQIIKMAQITNKDIVLEVGPGLGALTGSLLNIVKKVIAIEIDKTLFNYLSEKFANYDNIELLYGDILSIDLPNHDIIISNIPYSITGPLFEKLFYNSNPSPGVLTIERALANKLLRRDEYKKISRFGIMHDSFMKVIEKHDISRNSFYPRPSIPLSIIKSVPKAKIHNTLLEKDSRRFYIKFLAGLLPFKNKDIINALQLCLKNEFGASLEKIEIKDILNKHGFIHHNFKVFTLSIDQFIQLSQVFYYIVKS